MAFNKPGRPAKQTEQNIDEQDNVLVQEKEENTEPQLDSDVMSMLKAAGDDSKLLKQALIQLANNQALLMQQAQASAPKPIDQTRVEQIEKLLYSVDNKRPGDSVVFKLCNEEYQFHLRLSPKYSLYKDGFQFQLRYGTNFDNPFLEMQDGDCDLGSIDFENQLLVVYQNPALYRFLALHPKNKANGGSLFELDDESKKASEEYEEFLKQDEAKSFIKKAKIEDIKTVVSFVANVNYSTLESMDEKQIKLMALKLANDKYNDIISASKDERAKYCYDLNKAIALGIVEFNGKSLKLSGGKDVLLIPEGANPFSIFAEWVIREEVGRTFLIFLRDKMSK